MASRDKFQKHYANPSVFHSLAVALSGVRHVFKYEINFKIELGICILVFLSGFIFHYSYLEWALLLLCMGLVLVCELINTAIEAVTDLVTGKSYHIHAKVAKDAAAGAVMLASLTSVLVGMAIVLPKIWLFIQPIIRSF
ncbi:diacylglycerol kinase family protein [Dolosicoccus paucivorans]|uniref:diacylglycerol kinase family protein n=1 Tax=Dolosicoccus paucivorans TaxID=84521 RepID=UPI000886A289|nr:diacylglycerol kinase family protein [Dolosicoccus paucivorans]SDI31001.1 diacylglycerol kinase (ATP) [Dolosicoccus paucivorans]